MVSIPARFQAKRNLAGTPDTTRAEILHYVQNDRQEVIGRDAGHPDKCEIASSLRFLAMTIMILRCQVRTPDTTL